MEKIVFEEKPCYFDEHMLREIEEYQKEKVKREQKKKSNGIDIKH